MPDGRCTLRHVIISFVLREEDTLAAKFVNTPMTFVEATETCTRADGYLADDVHFARVLKDCVTTNVAIFLAGVHNVDTGGTCITAQLVNGDIQQTNRTNCFFKYPFVCVNTASVLTGGLCTSLEKTGTISTDAVGQGQLIGILGGVIAILILICVVAVGTVVCVRKRRQRQNPANDSIDLHSQRPTETVSARNDVGAIASLGQNNEGMVVPDREEHEYITISGDFHYDEVNIYERLQVADASDNPYSSPDRVVEIDPSPNIGEDCDDIQAVGSNVNQYINVDLNG